MSDNKNPQPTNHPVDNSQQKFPKNNSDQDKMHARQDEIEERIVTVNDQRRPQFRYNENFGRRNF